MGETDQSIALLKKILDNLHQPENLNYHPWADSSMVSEVCSRTPGLMELAPGIQLVETISRIFRMTMPNFPPKRGLRLDTRWGEFGILASQYFAPYLFNLPYPASLREAWQNIDNVILLFVFNNKGDYKNEDRNRYQLIGSEPGIAPDSTISDWHRKGLEKLSKFISQYKKQADIKAKIEKTSNNKSLKTRLISKLKSAKNFWGGFKRFVFLFIVVLITAGLWLGWDLYRKVYSLKQQAEEIIVIYRSPGEADKVNQISQRVSSLRLGLENLHKQVVPLLKYSHYLGWIPVIGGDISQASSIFEMVVQMGVTGDEVLQAVSPLLSGTSAGGSTSGILDQIIRLKDADNDLLAAQIAFSKVQVSRQKIHTERLSPRLYQLIVDDIDPFIFSLNNAFPVSDLLQIARLAPRLLGSVGNGKQIYMILIQNEDELRPTGGFLTAVGLIEVENGEIISRSFESSDMVDDLSKPYPKSPWQLDDYMMAEILLFRDSNWFTDFPTTVDWAKFLYAYTRTKEVDGVITVDQHVLQELLKIVGPIDVVGIDVPISADNALEYMRTAKENTVPSGISRKEWDRKQFISWLADPLIGRLFTGGSQNWKSLTQQFIQLLDEKHILLQFNDPEMSALIAKRGWDGAVRTSPTSDFLMAVDSNVGFNKTNVLMLTEIDYTANLTNLKNPTANLTITHTNNSRQSSDASADCIQAGADIRELPLDQREYIMDDCYWTYLRVYAPSESKLLSSTPHQIPQKWPLREQLIPARTDILDEGIFGTQTFGMLLVVPIAQRVQTNFSYQLPSTVVSAEPDGKTFIYRLKIQKQPGTLAEPMAFHIILPPGMIVDKASPELTKANNADNEWVLETHLNEDILVEINFQSLD